MDGSDYCNICGGKVIRKRLTFRNLLTHFFEQFFDYDNKFIKTLIHLISKPQIVIDGYVNGLRKRYVNPVSFFAVALTLAGLQLFIARKFFPESLDLSAMVFGGAEEIANQQMNNMLEYQSLLVMFNIPVYAFIAFIVFFTLKKYNYTEYLVLFLYTTAQMTFVFFIPQLIGTYMGYNIGQMGYVVILIQIIYTAYCFKVIFNISFGGLILRFMLFVLVSIFVILLIGILSELIKIFFVYGSFEEYREAQKEILKTMQP
ncbi:MAG: DUF3667 domain-containing protein [Bacteroidia bacterium]|nr:DUF3667 domain-containing protein [Bacteroidia bacterium]NND53327.1 DUF3667 domain-containing protein [Flavobacteriaceae bacterium]